MIISASRRTDIPAFYSQWFFNRIKEGYVLVPNPYHPKMISRISLSPAVVDCFVFWTKNPAPMLNQLDKLQDYNYYFQFTLNPYGEKLENRLPSIDKRIDTFKKLADKIGIEKMIWRYDPIFFNDRYTMEYHCKYFKVLAEKLGDYTEKCTVSFLDLYRNTARNMRSLNIQQGTTEQQFEMMQRFSEIAKKYGFYIDTCCEMIELEKIGISHAHCIDGKRFERIGKCKLALEKDRNQRSECGCVSSIDIGTYNTCKNGCLYCYANYNNNIVMRNTQIHNPLSPLLFGEIGQDDVIKERKIKSCKECQLSFFDL